jgi:hypothetical protein
MNIDLIREHFSEFSRIQASPIYATLSGFIATQPEILQLVSMVPLQKSPRTVFFAAVHTILLKGAKHPLAEFYPSLGGKKKISEQNRSILFAQFLDFFTRYQAEIKSYLSRSTQTNEAMRSIALLPAFSEIAKREHQSKFSLIEIGTSAGFLLNVDKYSYKLNELLLGNAVQIEPFTPKWQGHLPENLKTNFMTIENKIGVDINPIDIEDNEIRLWLKGLIWPEQVGRLRSFDLACKVLIENKKNITILKGTFDTYIEKIMSLCSKSETLCFLCVWVLYQLSEEENNKINEKLRNIARSRNKKIYFILDDWDLTSKTESNNIILREFDKKGDYIDTKVCQTHHHGEWIDSYI